jgi:hypothetical protein
LAYWLGMTARRIRKDPNRLTYTDRALTPVGEDDEETFDLYTHNETARHAVEHARKVAELTGAKSRAGAGVGPRRAVAGAS